MYSIYSTETWNAWTADFKLGFGEYEKQKCNGGCKVSCQSMVHYVFSLIHERSNTVYTQNQRFSGKVASMR